MQVRIKRLTETAIIPKYQSKGSAAIDLHADVNGKIDSYALHPRGLTVQIPTGLSIQIPTGYVGIVSSRSGLGVKKGLVVAHGVGVIDSDYRGPLMIPVWNRSTSFIEIRPGDRIVQMLFLPVEQMDLIEVEELDSTERGSGGFGSTGDK